MKLIKVSLFFRPDDMKDVDFVEATCDWPEDTFLQAGYKGLVIKSGGGSYNTNFVEAFPSSGSASGFYRGEGETLAEAEYQAWQQYSRAAACPGHEWEARGYRNGGGFCKHCNKFGTDVIDPRDLGQFCVVCGEPTTYGETTRNLIAKGGGNVWEEPPEEERVWACREHFPRNNTWLDDMVTGDTVEEELT